MKSPFVSAFLSLSLVLACSWSVANAHPEHSKESKSLPAIPVVMNAFSAKNPSSSHACDSHRTPPPAVDTSEVPRPGQASPPPLPLSHRGGPQLDTCGVTVSSSAAPLPTISAPAWLIADLDSGAILAASDPHGRYRPASTIKVLLALVVVNSLDLQSKITLTPDDQRADAESIVPVVQAGESHSVLELLQALLLISSNGAAHALSRELGGIPVTLAAMNSRAAQFGALDTRAATPSGLDAAGNSSSVYDLAVLFRAAMLDPTVGSILRLQSAPGTGSFSGKLLNRDPLLPIYPGTLAGKSGFTDDAQYNLVAAAEKEDRRLLVAVMNNPGNYPSQSAAALLDWGFLYTIPHFVGSLEQ